MKHLTAGVSLIALAASAGVASAAEQTNTDLQEVIVTGTRQAGLKAVDSPAPVQVVDAGTLRRVGQPNLIQALAQNVPSLNAQAFGGDTANLTLSLKLRGLSPNHTLVLINGKRRHGTANLAVLGGPYQGGASADLNFVPLASIDHVEVLQDGAAAQYGTDAIAGVVNIILKKNATGGSISATGGAYQNGGGDTAAVTANIGFQPVPNAYVNITAESKFHGSSDRGGIDPRVDPKYNPGVLISTPQVGTFPGYPYVNHISGDARYHLNTAAINAGYDFGNGFEAYVIGTYGHKYGAAYENYRTPSRLPTLFPSGFNPKETIMEDDFAITGGIKGQLAGWGVDLSTTYGKDDVSVNVTNSGNVSLFNDTGRTPTAFHAGDFIASQWTTNLDFNRDFSIGWATPLNVAIGFEHRHETYEIKAGDAASRYKEGSQSYPGFNLTDAGDHDRSNYAVYVDLAASPVAALKLDLAGRFEHFTDFGDTAVGKLTARYDFNPYVALRGTISTGFRAPTLAEEYYSATNVSPTSAFVQLPPNSAAARLIGVNGLQPETSDNYSVGLVLHPAPRVTATLDAYQISVKDRIVGSGSLYGVGGSVNSPAVVRAIAANGNVLDPTVTFQGISIFTNGLDTRTRGIEGVVSYAANYGDFGRVDWTLTGNYNDTEVTRIKAAPAQLAPQGLFDATAISDLETASPKYRLTLGAVWTKGKWTVDFKQMIYGPSSELTSPDGGTYYKTEIGVTPITDLEVGYALTDNIRLSAGANNLFNQYPDNVNGTLLEIYRQSLDNTAVTIYPSFSPFGINGGYYYGRATYTF